MTIKQKLRIRKDRIYEMVEEAIIESKTRESC